ncbi:MAG: hypothetical protein HZC42_05315 [Candidatus Eisenbacteria bacterium]|nr:hypothetical protein [Candidatus Eisenbacteria bacterium]
MPPVRTPRPIVPHRPRCAHLTAAGLGSRDPVARAAAEGTRGRVLRLAAPVLAATAFIVALAANPAAAVDTRLPSAAAGSGGKLAVRVQVPPLSRYADGAPVVVIAPGGHEPGVLNSNIPVGTQGFVLVTFLFPGGRDGVFYSDGIYDFRGPGCQLALADVLRFASGALADSAGRTISDLAGMPCAANDVGVLALSNGGSITPCTLGDYGATLPGVRYMVGWENPTGPQTITGELGTGRNDCNAALDGDGNGVPTDDGKNWAYAAYDTQTCVLDYAKLAWDPAFPVRYSDFSHRHTTVTLPGALFFDGNGNGVCDTVPGSVPSCPDLNGNGRLDSTEDYVLAGLPAYGPATAGDSLKAFSSPAVLAAARDRGLFGASWPAQIATAEMAQAYWDPRDATKHYALLGAARPDFAAMLVYRKGDHVQAEDDHAHIRQAYDGFRNHGMWCRLNPDSSYYAVQAPPPAGYVETPANAVVAGADMKAHAEPNTVDLNSFDVAGVCEMSDRVHYGVWDADLRSIIVPDSVVGVPAPRGDVAGALRVAVLSLVRGDGMLALRITGARPGAPLRIALHDVAGRTMCATAFTAGAESFEWRWRLAGPGGRPPAGLYWVAAREPGGRAAAARALVLP